MVSHPPGVHPDQRQVEHPYNKPIIPPSTSSPQPPHGRKEYTRKANIHSGQLSRADEATAGSEDNEVRREDQEKINRFSRLHQRETVLEEQLKAKQVCLKHWRRTNISPCLSDIRRAHSNI